MKMLTMTVLPLYWMIWQDRPTSLPPPRQRNLSSSAGSTGSSLAALAIAEALRLDAIVTSFASQCLAFKEVGGQQASSNSPLG